MEGKNRSDISPGLHVSIVLKKDQKSGKLTGGIVKDILTNSPSHPHGIKVRLQTGEVGRVKRLVNTIRGTHIKGANPGDNAVYRFLGKYSQQE